MKFLVIGGGSIGKRHIKNLKALGYDDIYCLKRKYSSDFEAETGAKVITQKDTEKLSSIDAVFICTPTALHLDGMALAKRIGASIFMEKPLIDTKIGLDYAKKQYAKLENTFFIGFMLRYHPMVKHLKKLIEEAPLGKIYSARLEFGSYLPYWHPWEDHTTGYAALKNMGGGVVNTICHELDLMLYFFGQPATAYCEKANYNLIKIEAEEIAEAIFGYADKTVTLHLDYLQKDYDRRITLLAENGKITWNWHENEIKVFPHKAEAYNYASLKDFDVNQLYIDELKHFITLHEQGSLTHDLNFDYALKHTEVLMKMHESAEKGQKVTINNTQK
jgi:predicted dehydrogenase